MKVVVIIQARMTSTRLPGKVMKEICGKTVLSHAIERVGQSKLMDSIIIATTINACDDIIEKEAKKNGVKVFRGSEEDVLSRYYFAAKDNDADVIVRITSDCPLMDPIIIDQMLHVYINNDYDMVTNVSNHNIALRTFPRGIDIEIFSFEMLEQAFINAKDKYQREHVAPYIYENSKKIYYFTSHKNYSKYRWTLDTQEDWLLISRIYELLYKGEHNFYMNDVLMLMEQYPELYKINEEIEQKKLK